MLIYKKITLNDIEWIREKLHESNYQGSEYSFANQFLWGALLHMETVEVNGCVCTVYRKKPGRAVHDFPFGAGDLQAAVWAVMEDDKNRGEETIFRGVTEAQKEWMEDTFLDVFEYLPKRGEWDYLYPVEELQNLSGKKYRKKRNHIARFKENGDWSYEDMSSKNQGECLDMYKNWLEINKERLDSSVEKEKTVVEGCFRYFSELKLTGGVLRQKGEVVGFCIGAPLNKDTYIIHIEKAYTQVQGAYPMINQQFATHNMDEYSYVNREDDLGLEGLRKAKLSYYPQLLVKYRVKKKDGKGKPV